MKLLILLLLVSGSVFGQSTYFIRADTITLQKVGGNTTLKIENGTRAKTGAYLRNYSNGRTDFNYAVDSGSVSGSNLVLWRGGGTQNLTIPIPGAATPTLQEVMTAGSTLTGDNTVVNDANTLTITNNTLAGDVGLSLSSTSTAAASDAQRLFRASISGVNANAGQSTYAGYFENTHTGTTSENYGILIGVSDASTANTGIYSEVAASSGSPINRAGHFVARQSGTNIGVDIETFDSGNIGLRVVSVDLGTAISSSGKLKFVTGNEGVGKVLVSDASGNADWATSASALTVPWSGVTASTSSTQIDNGAFTKQLTYNSLGNGSALKLTSTSTAAASNGQIILDIQLSGANANSSQITRGASISNIHTGTGSTNIGLDLTASGAATNNHAVNIAGGSIGLAGSAGTSGQVLTSAGANALPTWSTPVTESSTNTFTNKRWTARVGSTASSATPTINTDNTDIYKLTALAANITSFTTNLSGTPVDGDILEIQITDDGTPRTLAFGASFVASSITLPTTTSASTTLTIIFQYYTTSSYGNNKWVCANFF